MSAQTAPLGIIMLCHTALERAAAVARFWADAGCPVVIHLDRAVPEAEAEKLRAALAHLPHLRFSPRHRCAWGSWSLVQATQEAAALMLREFPDVGHVCLTSGACLPLRPAAEMIDWLAAREGVDFIESVAVEDVVWTVGGLSQERFTRWFPFDWRRQRWLFDRAVDLQRRLGLEREVPRPLRPHLGSQWWCLSRATLEAILSDPKRKRYERYFRQVWIPDEAYFQTLVRQHARRIESRALTLVKFDGNGRPHLFYDDHLQLLRRSDCFLARKIWPQADRLYDYFLSDQPARAAPVNPQPGRIHRHFSRAERQRREGRAGLYMQSRFPHGHVPQGKTAAPYSVLCGFAELHPGFDRWLSDVARLRVHGHLYDPRRVMFSGGARVYNGALSDSAALRDYNPRMFLTNLIWNTRGERQCLQYGPADAVDGALEWFMATDPNAHIAMIAGAWAVPLFQRGADAGDLRDELAMLQKREQAFLSALRSPHVRARVRIWSLAEYLDTPQAAMAEVLAEIAPRAAAAPPPPMVALDGFGAFLARARDIGLPLVELADYPHTEAPARPVRKARE